MKFRVYSFHIKYVVASNYYKNMQLISKTPCITSLVYLLSRVCFSNYFLRWILFSARFTYILPCPAYGVTSLSIFRCYIEDSLVLLVFIFDLGLACNRMVGRGIDEDSWGRDVLGGVTWMKATSCIWDLKFVRTWVDPYRMQVEVGGLWKAYHPSSNNPTDKFPV
jgi:hypothetical protein